MCKQPFLKDLIRPFLFSKRFSKDEGSFTQRIIDWYKLYIFSSNQSPGKFPGQCPNSQSWLMIAKLQSGKEVWES